MKYYFCVISSFIFFIGCSNLVQKPENLISEQKMEQILYDLSILNASKNVDYAIFQNHWVDVNQMIYKKNGIDSLQLAHSMIYYASKSEVYKKIVDAVEQRLIIFENELKEQLKNDTIISNPIDTRLNPDNPELLKCGVE